MTPARLAEIEAVVKVATITPRKTDLEFLCENVPHLIAEIRRLKHPTVTVSWKGGQEVLPLDKAVFHVERLQAAHEAAEEARQYLESAGGRSLIHQKWELHAKPAHEVLRRALDACAQDPAR